MTDQPGVVPHPDYPVVLCLSQQERAMLYAMLEDKLSGNRVLKAHVEEQGVDKSYCMREGTLTGRFVLARAEAENQWCRRLMAEIEGSMKGCKP